MSYHFDTLTGPQFTQESGQSVRMLFDTIGGYLDQKSVPTFVSFLVVTREADFAKTYLESS